jgi:hypothetical protein
VSRRALAASLVLILTVVGCGTAKWTYPPNEATRYTAADGHPQKVAVKMGSDRRSSENSNMFAMYLIPLVPWGWMEYDRPEAARKYNTVTGFDMDMSKDPALAVAEEFKRSGLFPQVYFTYGGDTDGSWICEVTPVKFAYNGRVYSYGLSVVAPLLWFIGLPRGRNECVLEFHLSLKNAAGKEVWFGSVTGSESVHNGLYYNWGRDVSGFVKVFEREMQLLLPQIEAALNTGA